MLRQLMLFMSTLAMGLIAGFFYTYEVSVMRGFAQLDDRGFIASMQAVNATIRNIPFALSFFGAAFLTALTLALHVSRLATRQGVLVLVACLTYIGGAFLLTMMVNVPLNDWLAAQGAPLQIADPAAVRLAYEGRWVFYNQIRTGASFVAFTMLVCALMMGNARPRADRPSV